MEQYIRNLDLPQLLAARGIDAERITTTAEAQEAAIAILDNVVGRLTELVQLTSFENVRKELPNRDKAQLLRDCKGNAIRAVNPRDVRTLLVQRISETYLADPLDPAKIA